jgi:SAM-dependent methyltransferase
MALPPIDWNEVWRGVHEMKHAPVRDSKFWDKRAHSFTRHATRSDYIGQFLDIMKPQPQWSVLDIGCAAGTLAVPLAPTVRSITALDHSNGMLRLLDERCWANGIRNIRMVHGSWEDDWDELGIGVHDVAVASRSLVVEDLRWAVEKLSRYAHRRVMISSLVDDGPFDRRIFDAVGRSFQAGADYIVVYNVLRQMGIYANIAFTHHCEVKTFKDMEDALNGFRWMIHEMTPEEEDRLRTHLEKTLVPVFGGWQMPYLHLVRWAVMWWDLPTADVLASAPWTGDSRGVECPENP